MINDKDDGFMGEELMNFIFQFPFAYLEYLEKARINVWIRTRLPNNG